MDPFRAITSIVASGVLLFSASAQFQVVHDAPNTTTTDQLSPLILPDGNTVTHHWYDGEHIFRKYDEGGALVWSRAMEGNSENLWNGEKAVDLLNDGSEGFLFVALDDIQIYPNDESNFEDSVVYSFHIAYINGNGSLTNALLVKKVFTRPSSVTGYVLGGFDAERTPDDGFILCITSEGLFASIDLFKMDATGSILWSRSVGEAWGLLESGEPTTTFNIEAAATVAVSPTGRVYYSEGGTFPYNQLRLGALDVDGSMLWMKRYVYGNTSPLVQYHDIAVDGAGNVHAGGALGTTVGRFHIFLRTDPDGVLDRGDLYRTPYSLQQGQLDIDGQGRRYHLATIAPTSPSQTYSHGILIADTLGTPARFMLRDDQVILPNNVFNIPQRIHVAGNRLAVSNLLHNEDVDLAYTTRYEALSLFDTDAIDACLMYDTTFAHIPIPLDPVMTTTVITNAVSLDVSAYYTSEPLSLTLTPLDPDALEPLCPFVSELLAIPAGLSADAAEERSPLLLNSFITQGSPIVLNDLGATALDVYDISGVLVQRYRLEGQLSLPTAGWSAGVYVVRAMDGRGVPLRAERLVLQ